jgi:hypothetical protein
MDPVPWSIRQDGNIKIELKNKQGVEWTHQAQDMEMFWTS